MRSCHETRRRLTVMATLVFCVAVVPRALGEAPDLDARLERLCDQLEARRLELHIPGFAIAIVKDDQVILSRGFGMADVEREVPVTPQTLFAIGSSTKAFTTAVIAMLVDQGVMSWDDPVSKYLPRFTLDIDTPGESVTIRDLCSHRTGFTRMGILWAGSMVPREVVLEMARTAEPWAGFREKFVYNNVMYLAAGTAAGVAAGSDWDALIQDRVFGPLGMTSSGTHISLVRDDPRLAMGYRWDKDTEAFKRLPMRDLDVIGPAGAINSNVVDMANWLRLQLGRGEFAGRRLVSAAQLQETWTPQIEIAPGIDYGLGWMVREWNGRTVIEHGGNIDGFAAAVTMLPDARTGFVLLANVTVTPLQSTSLSMVFDAVLGEAAGDESALDQSEMEPFLGTYIANIGQVFVDAEMAVLVHNGRLAVDVPGQMVYELKPPDEDGKRYFVVTDTIAVRFNREGEQPAYSMVMYQAGMEFEMPRKGVEYEPDVPLDELAQYLGRFYDEDLSKNITVLIQNNRLAVDVPGQMVFELSPPDDDGMWAFRAKPKDLQLRFNAADDGSIESMTLFQAGKASLLSRVEAEDADALPTVDELIALVRRGYGVDRRRSLGTAKMTGTITFVHQGAKGRFTCLTDRTVGYRQDLDLGELGFMALAIDGTSGWSDSSFFPFAMLTGEELAHRRLDHPLRVLGDWQADFDEVAVVRTDRVGDEPVYVVRLKYADAPARTVYVSVARGVVLREDSMEIVMQGDMTFPLTIEYGDFREVEGLTLPFRLSSENQWNGRVVVQLDAIEFDVTLPEGVFAPVPAASIDE